MILKDRWLPTLLGTQVKPSYLGNRIDRGRICLWLKPRGSLPGNDLAEIGLARFIERVCD